MAKPRVAPVLALFWALTGHALVAHGAGAASGATRLDPEPARAIRIAPDLRANASMSERDVVIGVCEREGVRQIAGILRRSDFEEMWAFLPRAHESRDCEWHEIGREEKAERESATLRVDMAYLEQLMRENAEIHIYHFHPERYFECATDDRCRRQASGRGSASFDRRWITDLVFAMPSPSDVHFMMDVTSRFHRGRPVGGVIRHRVVTPYGVVDYALTREGLAKYDLERHSRSEGLYITWVVANALDDERVEEVIREHPKSILGGIRRLAQTLNTEFLRVVFTPNPARRKAPGTRGEPLRPSSAGAPAPPPPR